MKQPYSLKIDAYSHIVPPKFKEVLHNVAPEQHDLQIVPWPPLYDLDARFRIMDCSINFFQGSIDIIHRQGGHGSGELVRILP